MKLFAVLFLALVLYGDVAAGNIPDANVVKNTWVPSLSSRMTNFAEKQLGSLQLQRLYDQRVMYKTQRVDGQAKIDELVKKLDDRLQQATTNLAAMQQKIQGLNMVHVPVSIPGCCQAPNPGKMNSRFKQVVSDPFQKGCAEIQDSTKGFLWPMMKTDLDANLQNTKPLTWQYYGDKYGNYYQYPTGVHSKFCPAGKYDDHRFRNWYVNTASPKKKNLVIIVDESFSMDRKVDFFDWNSPTRLEIAKEAAKTVLQTLSSDDWVGTVAFSDYARSPPGCFGDHVAQANDINKQHLVKFIDDIKPMSSTMYSSGLNKAFTMLENGKKKNLQQFENSLDMILFLTDGAPKDKPRSKVMEAIVDGQKKMNNTVHLLLYGFGDDVARDFTSQQFLLNMADQNQRKVKYTSTIRSRTQGLVTKHLVGEKWDPYPAAGFDGSQPAGPPGMIKIIGDSQYKELKTIMSSYYNFFPIWDEQNPTVTVPFLDKNHGLVTTMGLPVVNKIDNTLSGVVAFDMPLQIMFSDISQYKIGTHSYAFLIGTDGKVLMHRNLPQPKDYTSNPLFVDLSALEPTLSEEAKKNILRGIPGFDKQLVNLPVSRGSSKFDGAVNYKLNATYFYKPLPGSKGQYTVGLVLFDMDMLQKIPEEKAGTTSGQHSSYHRLDLKAKLINKTEEICQRYGSFSSVDSTVKFAPDAFKDPDKYLQEVEAINNVKDLESFLHSSSVTSNNDLKDYVKTDVIMTAEMEKYWKKTPESVWRYIGTETGVFRVFPGFVADKTYNPVEHAWYKRAMSRPEVYTFSRPEAGSLGDKNLVTVSRVFYQGR
ncbi:VWFA and cache domain-containing protein 1-like [Lingula anatina]|uniref:VWFA and cache domain-containing protein 1-like n=1 Tax=Lingula anatina TaxID=7574 RepID=A0A1S3H7E5_LINAN|nr:VWFA and cache domain-containing protein 1-like [Lingula anatina]|eukprot:XP_013382040.1 VWFA and cache domain-containing protein 1-like [Lingula anatina]